MSEKELIQRISDLEFDFGIMKIRHFARIEALETALLELAAESGKSGEYLKLLHRINYQSQLAQINELPEHLYGEYLDFLQIDLSRNAKNGL